MGVPTAIYLVFDGETVAATPEMAPAELDDLTRYVSLLGVGARRDLNDAQALQGEQMFNPASSTQCHTPSLTTSPHHPMTELRNQTIRPYTDLLSHDMVPGLADNMGEASASGSEWRTPPLWNIGLTAGASGGEVYLHDGRARSLEEAILWHGGEAEASKQAFLGMSAADRAASIRFLKSLWTAGGSAHPAFRPPPAAARQVPARSLRCHLCAGVADPGGPMGSSTVRSFGGH